jgi:intron-binding protein aquarius
MRRRANDNNWSSLLKPFRDVVGFENLIPDWLKAGFLGHEDPSGACYKNIENLNLTINFRDTFVDVDHVKDCFPNLVSSDIINQ